MIHILLLLLFAMVSATNAALISVAKDGIAQYNEVQPAINAALEGDTIFVAASSTSYAGFTVDRPLTIFGAGSDTLAGRYTKVNSACVVEANADGSSIQSIWFQSSNYSTPGIGESSSVIRMRRGAYNLLIKDCFVENTFTGQQMYWQGCVWVDTAVTAILDGCVFDNYPSGSTSGGDVGIILWNLGGSGSIQLVVTNCIFIGDDFGIQYGPAATLLTVRHCVFDPANALQVGGTSSLENSFCWASGAVGSPGTAVRYCAFRVTSPGGEGNFVAPSSNLVGIVHNDARHSNYHLSQGSTLINAGNPIAPPDVDGSRADIGVYGGQTPYSEFGFPNFPIVTELEVPASVPQNGVLRFGARGSIGEGN